MLRDNEWIVMVYWLGIEYRYYIAAKSLWDMALAANAKGDFFPIWGTCLGFQTVSIMASGNLSLLSQYAGVDGVSLPLNFTDATQSGHNRLFRCAASANVGGFEDSLQATAAVRHLRCDIVDHQWTVRVTLCPLYFRSAIFPQDTVQLIDYGRIHYI